MKLVVHAGLRSQCFRACGFESHLEDFFNSWSIYIKNMKPYKLLIVDDEEVNHLLLKHYFDDDSYKLTHAYNGKEAIDLVSSDIFDLILMDIRMPIIGGVEATKRIKKTHPKLPVIAVTAFEVKSIEENIFDLILNKPIIFDNIESVFDKYLRKTT